MLEIKHKETENKNWVDGRMMNKNRNGGGKKEKHEETQKRGKMEE